MAADPVKETISFKFSVTNVDGKQVENRRFCIDKDTACDYEAFKKKLRNILPSLKKGQDLKLIYTDSEGDDIVVSSSDELKCAIDQNGNLCKFQVILLKELPTTPKKNDSIHLNIKCNKCKKEIKGDRYKCIICTDYDCCSSCENSTPHGHPMIKIIKPVKTLDTILRFLSGMLKAYLEDQDCKHSDCSGCKVRRSCSNSWREGTISHQYLELMKFTDKMLGKCSKCALIKPKTAEPKIEPELIKPSPTPSPKVVTTRVTVVDVLPPRPQYIATRPVMLHQPMRPMLRPPFVPPAMFSQGQTLHYVPRLMPNYGFEHQMFPPMHTPPMGAPFPMCYGPNYGPPMGPMPHQQPGPNSYYPSPAMQPSQVSTPAHEVEPINKPVSTEEKRKPAVIDDDKVLPSMVRHSPELPILVVDEEEVLMQRHILELSSRGYEGDFKDLEKVLKSVDLDVEKASVILDLSKDL